MIKVLFFARIREQLNTESIELQARDGLTTGCIREQLSKTDNIWQKTMAENNLLIAVNQEVTDWQKQVNDGDEVAFFPPVTGG